MPRILALLAIALLGINDAYAQCDTSQPGQFLSFDPPNPTANQQVTITYRIAGWDVQSTSLEMHGNTAYIVATGSNGSFQPKPPIPCQTQTLGPLAAGRYTVLVSEAALPGSDAIAGPVMVQSFNVGISPGCSPSDNYVEVDPLAPDASQAIAITISPHTTELLGWVNTAIHGNRIDITISTFYSLFEPSPPPTDCVTQVVGPLPPGMYTVNLKRIDSSSGDSTPTLLEALSFEVGGNSLASCDPGTSTGYVAVGDANDLQPVTITAGRHDALLTSARTRPSGSTFNVTLSGSLSATAIPDRCLAVDLDALPASSYAVNIGFADSPAAPAPFASNLFTVTKGPVGPITSLWWNAAQPGWGLDLVQHGNIVFAAWYTYDLAGNPKWYVAPRCVLYESGVGQGCVSDLYEVHGSFSGPFLGAGGSVVATKVGDVNFDFPDAATGSMAFQFFPPSQYHGSGENLVTREPLREGPAPSIDFSDLWWNPAESGWGLTIEQQSDVMFLALYVFDTSGNPVWYVAPDCQVAASGQGCTGILYATKGPLQNLPFDPSKVQARAVGTATVAFSNASNGTLSYTINNSSVLITKPITRQAF